VIELVRSEGVFPYSTRVRNETHRLSSAIDNAVPFVYSGRKCTAFEVDIEDDDWFWKGENIINDGEYSEKSD
jgi:hypothetical protein